MNPLSSQPVILFMGINPKNTLRLRLDEELTKVKLALERGNQHFSFVAEGAVTDTDLRRLLLRHTPAIVHLSGHGVDGGDDGGFNFEDDLGIAHVISSDALADLFKLCQEHVQCVVLNGCYSESVAQAIGQHIPYVVGMSDTIGDDAAIKFSIGFYDALAHGRTFEDAFELGRNAIDLAGIPEALVPVLKKKPGAHSQRLSPRADILTKATATGLTPTQEQQLIDFLATEYATHKLARLLWQGAGGRPGQVDIDSEDAADLWRSLWRKAKNGAIKPTALIEAAQEKYPDSEVLKECRAQLRGN